jgi:uncharacterized membrane protein
MIIVLLIYAIYGALIVAGMIGLIWVIYNRIQEKKKENFERRDN